MLITRKCDALGHALLFLVLSNMPNWKNLFLFVLQQFPWWVTENAGVLCFFVPLFLSLYLRENVFGWFLFWCFCTVRSCQRTAAEEHTHVSLQLWLPPSVPVHFLSRPSCCSTVVSKEHPGEGHVHQLLLGQGFYGLPALRQPCEFHLCCTPGA